MRLSVTAVAIFAVLSSGCAGAQPPSNPGATPTAPAVASSSTPGQQTPTPDVSTPTPGIQSAPPEDCKISIDIRPEDPPPPVFPPPPADVSGMLEWLATACPAAAWLTRITGLEHVPGEVPDSGGFANAIVITTDLDFATEQEVAREIGIVLGEAQPEWADQFVIWYADGHNETAGDIIDMTP